MSDDVWDLSEVVWSEGITSSIEQAFDYAERTSWKVISLLWRNWYLIHSDPHAIIILTSAE